MNKKIDIKKHILIFIATALVFGAGFFLSDFVSEQKLERLLSLQENLRVDILSLETQFSILEQAPCDNLNESMLTKELYDISQKLTHLENSLGEDDPNFIQLKKFYSILEIKHWLLLKKAAKQCELNLATIIYFYGDKNACPDCNKQGYILTYLRKKYPVLRVYSFDFNLPLSAIKTLKSIYAIKKDLPALVIQDETFHGFHSKQELKDILSQYIYLYPKPAATSSSKPSTIFRKNSAGLGGQATTTSNKK